ncbi:MAG: hypothetical protein WD036_12585 [Bauldia sp.]
MRRMRVTVTTAVGGAATAYSPRISGELQHIEYKKHATTAYTDGVDFTITSERSGESLWTEVNINASTTRRPRAATHSDVGVGLLYAAGGAAVADRMALANDRVKIVLAAGGDAKIGDFYIVVK